MIKSELVEELIDEKIYWFSAQTKTITQKGVTAFLLSIYDEYTIAYNDRSALGGDRYMEKLLSMGNWLTSVIIVDGLIVGTWKRRIQKNNLFITLSPFRKFSSSEQKAVSKAADRYGEFLGMRAILYVQI